MLERLDAEMRASFVKLTILPLSILFSAHCQENYCLPIALHWLEIQDDYFLLCQELADNNSAIWEESQS